MKNVSIELPEELLTKLRERAKRERRSLRSEIAVMLAELVASDPMARIRLPADPRGICS